VGEKNLDLSQTDQAFRNSSNSSAMPTAMVNNLAGIGGGRSLLAFTKKSHQPTKAAGNKRTLAQFIGAIF
jgi:hypothetical protein